MASLEEIFVKEFNQMMFQLHANSNQMGIMDVPVPSVWSDNHRADSFDKVIIFNISDEHYKKLNDTEHLVCKKGTLIRRKFDYKGEFIKDKEGKYTTEGVTLPRDCIAILSDVKLGVPNKYKPKEEFMYVDYISREKDDGSKEIKYIYIVPKKYCYKINQTALVLSWTRLRSFYKGLRVALTNGSYVYVHVIPYKPTDNTAKNYRILCTKSEEDYEPEFTILSQAWVANNIMFNPADCQLYEGVKGRTNMAFEELNSTLDMHYPYNTEKSMDKIADEASAEELDIF